MLHPTITSMGGPGNQPMKRFRTIPSIPAKRQRRRRNVHVHELTPEIFTRIFRYLNIIDMHSCRLAGLVPKSSSAWCMVREDYLKYVRELQELRILVHRKVADATPLQFSQVTKLTLALPFGGVLPYGIRNMENLRVLDISARQGRSTDDVSAILGECGKISKLRIRRQMFAKFPDCILKLKNLFMLDLAKCSLLVCLPQNIGVELPKLRILNIKGCTQIKQLPVSLLQTLDKWASSYSACHDPLICTPTCFSKGYLREVIESKKFPRLANKCTHLFEENEVDRDDENGSDSDEMVDVEIEA